MKPLRVIFIESDAQLSKIIQPHYSAFFKTCGYDAEFLQADNERAAKIHIDKADPHVIVCDLGFDSDFSGLYLIKNLRTAYPDIFVIGTSRGEYSVRQFDNRQPSFHLFIDKQRLFDEDKKYIALITQRFLDDFRIESDVVIGNLATIADSKFKQGPQRRELASLVRQVIFAGHEADPYLKADEVFLEPLSGGFSGSAVFRMMARNRATDTRCVPSVLKVSNLAYAQQELRNYNLFVKWALPYTWRVDLLGHGVTKNLGAVAYSFALSDLKAFAPLTDYLRAGDDARVFETIRSVFGKDMRRWYGSELIQQEDNIVARYSGRYFRGAESKKLCEDRFLACVQKSFGGFVSGPRITIDTLKFELPTAFLFGRPHGSYRSCICHGDLNSNNLILADNGQLIMIDFQETGRGHVFEDFVTMEASVRLYHGGDMMAFSTKDILGLELAVAAGGDPSSLPPMYRIIAEIRRLAAANFPDEPFHLYHYANAAFSLRLLRVENLGARAAERVVASALASMDALMRSGLDKAADPPPEH